MGIRRSVRRIVRRHPITERVRSHIVRHSVRAHSAELTLCKQQDHFTQGSIVLVACMRDEALRLPDFFRHYRELGVDRFALIDNGSDDGTVEIASAQPDVEMWHAAGSFDRARGGMAWVMAVIQRYRAMGASRWFLFVDLDEHLVYDGCENYSLHDLAAHLEDAGQWAFPTFMLDMYPDGPVRDAHIPPNGRLLAATPMFDSDYEVDESAELSTSAKRQVINYFGGPRRRLFNERKLFGIKDSPRLAKVPFACWSDRTLYFGPHEICPVDGNFARIRGALLHFKFLSDFYDKAIWAIGHGEHWNNSAEYRAYRYAFEASPNMQLMYESSRCYHNSKSLTQADLISEIDWSLSARSVAPRPRTWDHAAE